MRESIDWIRVTFTGSISGGLLWAATLKAISIATERHFPASYFYLFASWVSLCIFVAGSVLYFFSWSSSWRSTAVGIILATLPGWSIIAIISGLIQGMQ